MTQEEFWVQLIQMLEAGTGKESDPTYYSSGQAQEGEWGNVVAEVFRATAPGSPERAALIDFLDESGFFLETDDLDYWKNLSSDAERDIQSLVAAGEERLPTLLEGSDGTGVVDDTVQPDSLGNEAAGVLAGGQTYRISRDGQEDIYVQMYEWPAGSGRYVSFQYDSLDALKQALGGTPDILTMSEDNYRQVATPGGNAAEITGLTGTFDKMMSDIQYEAAQAAGITDPTVLSQYLADPEIQEALVLSAIGGWTEAQTKAALRNTAFYTDVLYPGIDNFYGQTNNPEGAWRLYVQNVTSNLTAMGVPRDADGTYKSTVEKMLDGGVQDTTFAQFAPTYIRATTNDAYRESLNGWLSQAGIAPVSDFESWFDVLAGTAPPEINEVIELATLAYTAENQGLQIADDFIRELGMRTDLTEGAMQQLFSDTDRQLFALGDAGLRNYDLSLQKILNARAGIGEDVAATNALIEKVKVEQGLSDEVRARIFTDFNQEGQPIKAGLESSLSEGA